MWQLELRGGGCDTINITVVSFSPWHLAGCCWKYPTRKILFAKALIFKIWESKVWEPFGEQLRHWHLYKANLLSLLSIYNCIRLFTVKQSSDWSNTSLFILPRLAWLVRMSVGMVGSDFTILKHRTPRKLHSSKILKFVGRDFRFWQEKNVKS